MTLRLESNPADSSSQATGCSGEHGKDDVSPPFNSKTSAVSRETPGRGLQTRCLQITSHKLLNAYSRQRTTDNEPLTIDQSNRQNLASAPRNAPCRIRSPLVLMVRQLTSVANDCGIWLSPKATPLAANSR